MSSMSSMIPSKLLRSPRRRLNPVVSSPVVSVIGTAVAAMLVLAISGCSALPSSMNWNPADTRLAQWLKGDGERRQSRSASRRAATRDQFAMGEGSPDRLVLQDLAPSEISTTFRAKFSGEDQSRAEGKFRKARATYDRAADLWERDAKDPAARKLFIQAARDFRVAAAAWPDSALEQDALFMMGESRFFAHHYVAANRAYEQLAAFYPGTQHMDLVQARRFAIAQYWLELDRHQHLFSPKVNFHDHERPVTDLAGSARRILHNIRLVDPTGKISDDATMALANAFFEDDKFEDAADTYEDLRRTYPGSRHQFHAHLLELKARMMAYRGPSYDGTHLNKADRLLKNMVSRFPQQVAEHQDYLEREAGQIRHQLAERDFQIARYFERRGENRAARIYYESVAEEFSETDLADQSLMKLGRLAGEPDVPDQPVAWFVNLFPEPKSTRPLIGPSQSETVFR